MEWIKQLRLNESWITLKEKVQFHEIPQKLVLVLFTYLFMQIQFNDYSYLNYFKYLTYLPLFAAIYFLSKDMRLISFISILVTSVLMDYKTSLDLVLTIVLFYIFIEGLSLTKWTSLNKIPLASTLSIITSALLLVILKKLTFTYIDLGILIYTSVLAYLFTYVFIKGISVLFYWNKKEVYTLDELTSFMIIVNFLMIALPQTTMFIIGKVIIVIVSFYGGLLLGVLNGSIFSFLMLATGNVQIESAPYFIVTALVISLWNKRHKFFAVATYLLISLTIYLVTGDAIEIEAYGFETLSVLLIFIVTPKSAVKGLLVRVEGSSDYVRFQKAIYSDMRGRTSQRINQLASVFKSMSKTLSTDKKYLDEELAIEKVQMHICSECSKRLICYGPNKEQTLDILESVANDGTHINQRETFEFIQLKNMCYSWNSIMNVLNKEREIKRIKKEYEEQLNTAKSLVGNQLNEVASVMEDFSLAIQEEKEEIYFLRENIIKHLKSFRYDVIYLNIETFKDYPLVIDLVLSNISPDDLQAIILPVLSSYLKEPLHVKYRKYQHTKEGLLKVRMVSKIEYSISLGAVSRSKVASGVCGDSVLKIKLPKDRYCIAISDGMGSGERAYYESKETLRLLGQMLKSEIKTNNAVKTLNTIMSIRGQGEIFSTIDMAIFDFKKLELESIKVGAAPSFILRGSQIIRMNPNNLPVGIVKSIQVEEQKIPLMDNDMILMITDGAMDYVDDFDGILRDLRNNHPQALAQELLDKILEEVEEIQDDITILAVKVKKKG